MTSDRRDDDGRSIDQDDESRYAVDPNVAAVLAEIEQRLAGLTGEARRDAASKMRFGRPKLTLVTNDDRVDPAPQQPRHAPLILVDQDGPLAKFDDALHRVLDEHGYDSTLLTRTEWETTNDIRRCFGDEAGRIVDEARHAPGFYRGLDVVEGAQHAIAGIIEAGCDVVVCTAPSLRNPTCASDKIAWIAEHFPLLRDRFTVVRDKTLVRGHVLLDDNPDVTGALTPSWRHVKFATPGNAHSTDGDVLHRWSDWTTLVGLATDVARAGLRV